MKKIKNTSESFSQVGLFLRWVEYGLQWPMLNHILNHIKIFWRAPSYFRLQSVDSTFSPTFQTSTQFGSEKRVFHDDFLFKVSEKKLNKNLILSVSNFSLGLKLTASKSGEFSMYQMFNQDQWLTSSESFLLTRKQRYLILF